MKKNSQQRTIIKRELKIDNENRENQKDFREVEDFLRTISNRFMKEPLTIENLDKAYTNIVNTNTKMDKTDNHIQDKSKSKKNEEKSIFYDIFIKPKENKIKEIRMKRNEQKGLMDDNVNDNTKGKIFISNKINEIDKNNSGKIKSILNNINTSVTNKSNNQSHIHNESISGNNIIPTHSRINTNDNQIKININSPNKDLGLELIKLNVTNLFKHEANQKSQVLYNFLKDKFIPNHNTKKNFFNQLIQIRPPEGINAVSASPLIDSNKGWAPSIPSIQINKTKPSLNDLLMRAKGGIQAGDIPKEAHMAFYLGMMNEEERKYEEALKFYKKFFLSAKLLQDVYGTELALNRIAVLYSNIFDFNQSLYYNEKHKDITTHNVNGFVAYYNCGVCQRILGKVEDSIKSFNKALQMSEDENDLESYTLCLCQISISFLFNGSLNSYIEYSEEFFNKNSTLNHKEMEIEMLLTSGFVYNLCGNFDTSKESYLNSLKQATQTGNELYKAISICNVGIIEASKDFDEFMDSLNMGI